MSTVLHDLRHAFRLLIRNPGFTMVAVLTLALGIGATTTICSFVNAVVLQPLAYHDSRRLVLVQAELRGRPFAVSPGDFLDWQDRTHVFEAMTAFMSATYSLTSGGDPERVLGANVSSRFFETLGVQPLIGTAFGRGVDRADASAAWSFGTTVSPDIVVIGSGLWRRRFGADPAIVGKTIALDGKPFTVVGVMPRGFDFPRDLAGSAGGRIRQDVEVWAPLGFQRGYRSNAMLQVVARLKPGVTREAAQAEMGTIAASLAREFPRDGRFGVGVIELHERIVREVRPLLIVFLSAVGFLLLIACTNVANLLLGRAAARQREVAIRAALGSGRRRLVQQFLTESVLLGLAGGLAGLLIAVWGVDLVTAFIPPGSLPRLGEVAIDPRVCAFTIALSFITGLAFSIAPALQSSSPDIATALKTGGNAQTARSRFLNLLVVSEVALAFVLMAGAGLMLKSFLRLTRVDPGFRPDSVLAVSVTLPDVSYPTSIDMRAFSANVLQRLRVAPGISQAGAVNWLPIGGPLLTGDIVVEETPPLQPPLYVSKPAVSPDYFQAMTIPLLHGRAFGDRDTEGSPGVAIVTDRVAKQLWPGRDPLGKRLKIFGGRDDPWLSVVGVVGDIRQTALNDTTRPAVYVPVEQAPRPFLLRSLTFVVRTGEHPTAIAPVVRDAIRHVDPALPLDRIDTMRQVLADSVSEPRFRSVVLASFASTAVVLVAMGILGVLAYSVGRRTREIGIRMALGAQRVDVVRLVVAEALAMTAIGVAIGGLAAAALTRLLTRFLFEVRPLDPAIFAAAAVALAAVALVSAYLPARRAASVDPLIALRIE